MTEETQENSKDTKEAKGQSDDEILRIAHERFDLALDAWNDVRQKGLEDLRFIAGEQWDEQLRQSRQQDGRPCLVINRMPQHCQQLENEQRQNRSSIKVSAVDDQGDEDTARVIQGMTRHIEYDSNADVAYDTAFSGAVRNSFGFWRVRTEYVSPKSFNQKLIIEPIRNAFSVLLDPFIKLPDGSDANWGFIVSEVPEDVYRKEHKESKQAGASWDTELVGRAGWISGKSCRVAEYFTKELEDIELVLLSDGTSLESTEIDEKTLPEGLTVVDRRKSQKPVVKWYKLNAMEILERGDWLGKWIPIIPAFGNIIDVDGEIIIESLIRHSKDSQRMVNFWTSTAAETIALAPKAPFIGYEGQFEGHEEKWATANQKNWSYLEAKTLAADGTPVPLPQRQSAEPAIQAITQAQMLASEDIKTTTGQFDAAMGQRSNETSGIAILGRQQQAQNSNFHFIDNLNRSKRHTGRILVDLIPKVYDYETMARIIGEEGEEELVLLNKIFEENGEDKIYDLGKGEYDVTLDTGPSFQNKREAAQASMVEMFKAAPQLMGVALDLFIKNTDIPGRNEIAERVKKTMPPGIVEDDKNGPPVPPQVQAQMQAMAQQIEQLSAIANEQAELIKTKKIELESKERIEFAKIEKDLTIEQMKVAPQEGFLVIAQELADINARLQLVGINRPIESDLNGAGPEGAVMPIEQQPLTGELPPGNYMGDMP